MVAPKQELGDHRNSFSPLPCLLPASGPAQGWLGGSTGLLCTLLSDRKRSVVLSAAQRAWDNSQGFVWPCLGCTYFQSTSSRSLMVPSSVMSTMMAWGLVLKKLVLSQVTTPTRIVARPRSSVTCRDTNTGSPAQQGQESKGTAQVRAGSPCPSRSTPQQGTPSWAAFTCSKPGCSC